MATMTSTSVGRITGIERLTNSYYGNPRFRISWQEQDFTPHAATTSPDSSYSYEIGNPGYRVGCVVQISLNGRGSITAIEPAETP